LPANRIYWEEQEEEEKADKEEASGQSVAPLNTAT
jgi:hypothetical protein